MDNKTLIIEYCKDLGLTNIGVMRLRYLSELKDFFLFRQENGLSNEFEEKNIEKRINPLLLMPQGKSIISIAFPYLYDPGLKGDIYFSKYTLGSDYHKVVSNYLDMICKYINTLGGEAIYFVDSNELPERFIAAKSGVGFIGKNNMLITEKYGSYVFLGEIITDLALSEDSPIESKCGECNKCLVSCPTKAIGRNNNGNKCLSYVTQKKQIEDECFESFKGRMFGCDTCQRVCPFNCEKSKSNIPEFKPFDYMENIDIIDLLTMRNKVFNEKYKITSCGWRGKSLIQRNALINLVSMGKEVPIDIKDVSSNYVRDYYDRLLNYFNL